MAEGRVVIVLQLNPWLNDQFEKLFYGRSEGELILSNFAQLTSTDKPVPGVYNILFEQLKDVSP